MKKLTLCLFALAWLGTTVRADEKKKDTFKGLLNEQTTVMSKTLKVLEGLKTEKDLEPALKKLKPLGEESKKIRSRFEALEKPEPAEAQKIIAELRPKIEKLGKAMTKETKRIKGEEWGEAALKKIQATMQGK